MAYIEEIDGKRIVVFSDEEKKRALNYFVTSTDDDVYGIINVPEEVFGAFASFFSRNPKDFRDHLFDAIIGNIKGFELSTEEGLKNLESLLRGDYRFPAEVLEKGVEKARKFYETWYGRYGHKSIGNVVQLPFIARNVSQIIAYLLSYEQLNFFIEQSTRYVEWNRENILFPPEIMNSPLREFYVRAIDFLIDTYHYILEEVENYYRQIYPFDKWIEMQGDEIKKDRKRGEIKYKREIKGKALDCARYLLPQSSLTNIAFRIDARSLERDLSMWKNHPLNEVRRFAELLEKHGKIIAPSLLKYLEVNEHYSNKYYLHDEFKLDLPVKKLEKSAKITHVPENSFDRFIAFILRPYNPNKFDEIYERVREMTFDEKMKILERYVEKRKWHDEFIGMEEEADQVKVNIEIVSDLGAIRDLRRHQKNDRCEIFPPTLDLGYSIPLEVEEIGGEVKRRFENAMEIAHESEIRIRKEMPYYHWYVIPMAAHQILNFSIGVDQLQYLIFTRSTPEGNPSYRQDMFNLVREVGKKLPWLLGYREEVDGDVIEIFNSSPFAKKIKKDFKNVPLYLRTEETGLHT